MGHFFTWTGSIIFIGGILYWLSYGMMVPGGAASMLLAALGLIVAMLGLITAAIGGVILEIARRHEGSTPSEQAPARPVYEPKY